MKPRISSVYIFSKKNLANREKGCSIFHLLLGLVESKRKDVLSSIHCEAWWSPTCSFLLLLLLLLVSYSRNHLQSRSSRVLFLEVTVWNITQIWQIDLICWNESLFFFLQLVQWPKLQSLALDFWSFYFVLTALTWLPGFLSHDVICKIPSRDMNLIEIHHNCSQSAWPGFI